MRISAAMAPLEPLELKHDPGCADIEIEVLPAQSELAGARPGRERVRKEIRAVLVPEDDNPYDPNAVAVWIDGLQVGHLSRESAQRYRPGLLAQQQARGVPIALPA